jgi:hypothetical protein
MAKRKSGRKSEVETTTPEVAVHFASESSQTLEYYYQPVSAVAVAISLPQRAASTRTNSG